MELLLLLYAGKILSRREKKEGKGVMFIVFQWDVINCVALMAPLNPKYGNHKLGNAARKIVDGRIDINIHALLLALDSRDLSTS